MSAARLAGMIVKDLTERRERSLSIGSSIRYAPAMVSEQSGAVVAPPTCEDIALRTIEANAYADAYRHAILAVEEIYKQMTAPEEKSNVAPKPKEAPYQ